MAAAFRLLLCFLIATFWFCSLANAAAVHNMIPSQELATADDEAFANSIRARRSSSDDKICHAATPCGWAVYVPFTRSVDYFMRNTCKCPELFKCIRTDDDLSVSAYVYRCRDHFTAADIESPN